jgi:hypothetical protein
VIQFERGELSSAFGAFLRTNCANAGRYRAGSWRQSLPPACYAVHARLPFRVTHALDGMLSASILFAGMLFVGRRAAERLRWIERGASTVCSASAHVATAAGRYRPATLRFVCEPRAPWCHYRARVRFRIGAPLRLVASAAVATACDCGSAGVAIAAVALASANIARLTKTTNTTAKRQAALKDITRPSTTSRPSASAGAISARALRMPPHQGAKRVEDARKTAMHAPRHVRSCLLSPPMTIPFRACLASLHTPR